jgi:hypothetical protein
MSLPTAPRSPRPPHTTSPACDGAQSSRRAYLYLEAHRIDELHLGRQKTPLERRLPSTISRCRPYAMSDAAPHQRPHTGQSSIISPRTTLVNAARLRVIVRSHSSPPSMGMAHPYKSATAQECRSAHARPRRRTGYAPPASSPSLLRRPSSGPPQRGRARC